MRKSTKQTKQGRKNAWKGVGLDQRDDMKCQQFVLYWEDEGTYSKEKNFLQH